MTKNVLNQQFITKLWTSLEKRKSVSKMTVNSSELTNVLYTIWKINQLETDETMIDGSVSIEGYLVPAFLKKLVFPRITLTGSNSEQALVQFEIDETIKGKVLSKREMLDITEAIYGTQRKPGVSEQVWELINTPRSISDYRTQLTVDETSVSNTFEVGLYPLNTVYTFIKEKYSGMDVTDAIDDFIINIVNEIR